MKIISNEYQINNSDVAPDATTVNLGSKNALFGVGHNLSALATHNIVSGEAHIVTDTEDASHQAIFGYANEVKDNYGGVVAGFENQITTTAGTLGNYVFGGNNVISAGGGWNFLFGRSIQLSSEGVVALLSGSNNTISMDYAIAFGSVDIQKTTTENFGIGIGNNVYIRGDKSVGIGHSVANSVDAHYSFCSGYQSYATNYGQHVQASGFFSQQGDAQTSVMVARGETTDDTTAVKLSLDGSGDLIGTYDDKSYTITIETVARDTASQDSWYQRLFGLVSRGTGAASLLVDAQDNAGVEGGTLTINTPPVIAVDTTTGELYLEVKGQSATTIKWVARITMTEVGV